MAEVYNASLEACREGLDYIWIDSCCIDKDSSSELSEAINSMFEYYEDVELCYVYLEDCRWCPKAGVFNLQGQDDLSRQFRMDLCSKTQLMNCRWLTRGWTLQELIAPHSLAFFDQNWQRTEGWDVSQTVCESAGVPMDVLVTTSFQVSKISHLQQYAIAERMSWAAGRLTTRVEDEAYALLGLFDVNMPLLYGEGRKAFNRLQRALIDRSTDDSIFAWENPYLDRENRRLLARSPADFAMWKSGRSKMSFVGGGWGLSKRVHQRAFEAKSEGLSICLSLLDSELPSTDMAVSSEHPDSRLSWSVSYAALTSQLTGFSTSNQKQIALKLRHWSLNGDYVFSEIIAAPVPELDDYHSMRSYESEGFSHRRLSQPRLFAYDSSEVESFKQRNVFLLWEPVTPEDRERSQGIGMAGSSLPP